MSPIYVHFCSCQNLSKFLKAWVWHSSNEDTCHCMWFVGFWNILKSTLIYQTIYIFDLRKIFFHHTAFTSTFAPVYTKETFRSVLKLELFSQLPLKEFSQERPISQKISRNSFRPSLLEVQEKRKQENRENWFIVIICLVLHKFGIRERIP